MTTWKLLDELGGHAVAVIHKGKGIEPWDVVVDLGDQSFPAQLPATVLTEVLPPEPTELGWYLGTIGEKESVIWRNEQGWRLRDSASIDSWKQLHEDFPGITVVRLVPAPEPVTLPWSGQTEYGSGTSVLALVTGKVNDVISDGNGRLLVVTLTPDLARAKAYALLTAADEADRRVSDATP